MNRNGLITGTITQEAKDERLKIVVEGAMEVFQPSFNEMYVRICDAATVFKMEEVRPILHVVVERHVTFLTGDSRLHNRNRNARMASNVGE